MNRPNFNAPNGQTWTGVQPSRAEPSRILYCVTSELSEPGPLFRSILILFAFAFAFKYKYGMVLSRHSTPLYLKIRRTCIEIEAKIPQRVNGIRDIFSPNEELKGLET